MAIGATLAVSLLINLLSAGPGPIQPQDPATGLQAEPSPLVVALVRPHERKSKIYCSCNNIDGRDLVFDLRVENRTDHALSAFLLAWVANDHVDPPERGLWPLSAVDDNLTATGELDVRRPETGYPLRLDPGETQTISGASLLQPVGWADGALVRFTTMRVEIWSADHLQLFTRQLPIDLVERDAGQ